MGAPRKNPPKDAATTIRELATTGHTTIGIAAHLGVAKETFKRWLVEDELLQDAFELGRESERQALHAMVVEAARTGKPANVNAFFILKARHGYVEADRLSQRVAVSVDVKNVLMVQDHGSDEEWEAKLASQQAGLGASPN